MVRGVALDEYVVMPPQEEGTEPYLPLGLLVCADSRVMLCLCINSLVMLFISKVNKFNLHHALLQ
jgi:hypothetical protein